MNKQRLYNMLYCDSLEWALMEIVCLVVFKSTTVYPALFKGVLLTTYDVEDTATVRRAGGGTYLSLALPECSLGTFAQQPNVNCCLYLYLSSIATFIY